VPFSRLLQRFEESHEGEKIRRDPISDMEKEAKRTVVDKVMGRLESVLWRGRGGWHSTDAMGGKMARLLQVGSHFDSRYETPPGMRVSTEAEADHG
jgi:hypothetical protein